MAERKTIDELTLMDDYMFAQVMRNTDHLKPLLEYILGFTIVSIHLIEPQRTEKEGYDSKAIRLDLYVEDENHIIYNVEVQTSNKKNLPKRMRYYQSVLDVSILAPGVNYRNLKDTYVIFICSYDPYERERYIYTFENMCKEENDLPFGDGTRKVVINTKGKVGNVSQELLELIQYLNDGTISGEYSRTLEKAVNDVKSNEERRLEYMNMAIHEMEIMEEAFEQGIEQGIEQGVEQGIEQEQRNQFHNLVNSQKKGIITLEQAAAIAGMSPDEFIEKMRVL